MMDEKKPVELESAEAAPPAPAKLMRVSAGVPEDELNSLDTLASEHAVSRSEVVRLALRDFLNRHQDGDVALQKHPDQGLKLAQPASKKSKVAPKKRKGEKPVAKKAKKGDTKKKKGEGKKKGGKKKKK